MQLHLDLVCTSFKETTGKLEEKVNALQLKQEELSKEKIILREQVKELTAANVALHEKVAAQEKEVSVLRHESSTFVWKINGFNEILQRAINGTEDELNSKPFFTGKTGYKLSVGIDPYGNQSKRNRYLSVYLRFMKGDHDNILVWPFHYKVTFTLIDQQDDPAKRQNVAQSVMVHESKPTSNVSSYIYIIDRFVSHSVLRTRRYIVNNTLFLQVEIGPPS